MAIDPEDFGMNNGKFPIFSRVFGFRNNAPGISSRRLYSGYNHGRRHRIIETATETRPRIIWNGNKHLTIFVSMLREVATFLCNLQEH